MKDEIVVNYDDGPEEVENVVYYFLDNLGIKYEHEEGDGYTTFRFDTELMEKIRDAHNS